MPELDWSKAPIQRQIKTDWSSPEIGIEGSLNCTKTTLFLDKEIDAVLKWPGIPTLLYRWTDEATESILKPAFEELLAIRDLHPEWDGKKKHYTFENGSKIWMHGLKSVSQVDMFKKIRGRGVCRIAGDQCEEMDPSVAQELSGRLRPSLTATVVEKSFPFQLTFVWNCDDHDFWLSKMFPLPKERQIQGRKLYSLSIYDNPFIPQASIDSLLRNFPPDHPKHKTMVLGLRAPNILGDPIFGAKSEYGKTKGVYHKTLHHRPIDLRPDLPIYEAFHIGEHNPTWIYAQPRYAGGLVVLGGIRGEELLLKDFLPIVQQYRSDWFQAHMDVRTAIAPLGEKENAAPRHTSIQTLQKEFGVKPVWKDNANAADVQLGMIDELAVLMRERNPSGEERFGVNDDPSHFLIVNSEGARESPFAHHAFEAGAVWAPKGVSIANKDVSQIKEDDKFANVVHCVSNILLNFCASRPTLEEQARKKAKAARDKKQPQRIVGGEHSWMA